MILAIDTSTRLMSLALVHDQQVLVEFSWQSNNQHNTQLSMMLHHLLAAANTTAHDLQAVAVSRGPGSFTGVRIGMAAAKGIALAHGLPLYCISSLDVVAHTLPLEMVGNVETIYAMLPAGRGRLIASGYRRCDQQYCPITSPQLMTWAEFANQIDNENVWLVGELDTMIKEDVAPLPSRAQLLPPTLRLHRAATLGLIAPRHEPDDPIAAMPYYIKEP